MKEQRIRRRRYPFMISLGMIAILISLGSCSSRPKYKDGVYFGESEGYYSTVKVQVTIQGGRIWDIQVLEHEEPEILADIVFDRMPPKMMKANTNEVDVIAGATYTSQSMIEAVGDALEKGK